MVEDDPVVDDEDFEFAIISDGIGDVTGADEIFHQGMIRPVYPVFGRDFFLVSDNGDGVDDVEKRKKVRGVSLRKLMIEEGSNNYVMDDFPSFSSSSESDDLEKLPEGSYCVWRPGSVRSPEMKKKSKSTGNSSNRLLSLRDFIIGRSHSDGKKKFHLVTSSPSPQLETKKEMKQRQGENKLYYVKRGEDKATAVEDQRQRLPYKKELIGIFTGVNGTTRGLHPF